MCQSVIIPHTPQSHEDIGRVNKTLHFIDLYTENMEDALKHENTIVILSLSINKQFDKKVIEKLQKKHRVVLLGHQY